MVGINFFFWYPIICLSNLFFQGVEKRHVKMFSQRNELYAFPLHSTPLTQCAY